FQSSGCLFVIGSDSIQQVNFVVFPHEYRQYFRCLQWFGIFLRFIFLFMGYRQRHGSRFTHGCRQHKERDQEKAQVNHRRHINSGGHLLGTNLTAFLTSTPTGGVYFCHFLLRFLYYLNYLSLGHLVVLSETSGWLFRRSDQVETVDVLRLKVSQNILKDWKLSRIITFQRNTNLRSRFTRRKHPIRQLTNPRGVHRYSGLFNLLHLLGGHPQPSFQLNDGDSTAGLNRTDTLPFIGRTYRLRSPHGLKHRNPHRVAINREENLSLRINTDDNDILVRYFDLRDR